MTGTLWPTKPKLLQSGPLRKSLLNEAPSSNRWAGARGPAITAGQVSPVETEREQEAGWGGFNRSLPRKVSKALRGYTALGKRHGTAGQWDSDAGPAAPACTAPQAALLSTGTGGKEVSEPQHFCFPGKRGACPPCPSSSERPTALPSAGLRRGQLPLHHQGDHRPHGQLHLPRRGPRGAVPDPRPAGEWLVNGSCMSSPQSVPQVLPRTLPLL